MINQQHTKRIEEIGPSFNVDGNVECLYSSSIKKCISYTKFDDTI